MKKKIAGLLMCLIGGLSVLTGCNLVTKNNYAGLNSIVATSGDIKITREQLLNAYNSSGYYYNQYYGKSVEEALKLTIDELINRQYLLSYIDEKSAEPNSKLKLSEREVWKVVEETWEYIDSSVESVADEVAKELNYDWKVDAEEEENSSENTYSGYTPYETKFKVVNVGGVDKIVKIEEDDDDNSFVPVDVMNKEYQYDYKLNLSKNKDFENIVWRRYISNLKQNQAYLKYDDTSDSATFKRQVKKIYDNNMENAKISKLEKTYGDYIDGEGYALNDTVLKLMSDYYNRIYSQNVSEYNNAKNLNNVAKYYKKLIDSSKRGNYFYYGEGEEKLLTCIHILVKFSDEQSSQIEEMENDEAISRNLDTILTNLKSQENTFATVRDPETGDETTRTISIKEMFANLYDELKVLNHNSDTYLQEVTNIFNKYIYTYGQDTGIMNATFDYVVGTNNSTMVESFTKVVRDLYNGGEDNYSLNGVNSEYPFGVGFEGAISSPFLEEASNYTGYHIVLFTGVLENITNVNSENIFEKLGSVKTSLSYNQTLFEYIYDKIEKDNFNIIQSNIISSIKSATNYDTSKYDDLYKK